MQQATCPEEIPDLHLAHLQTDNGIKPDPIHIKVLNSEFKNSHYELPFREKPIYLFIDVRGSSKYKHRKVCVISSFLHHDDIDECSYLSEIFYTNCTFRCCPETLILGQKCQSSAAWERLASHEAKALREGCTITGPVAGLHTQFSPMSYFQHRYGVQIVLCLSFVKENGITPLGLILLHYIHFLITFIILWYFSLVLTSMILMYYL